MRRVVWLLFLGLFLAAGILRPSAWTLAPCAILLAAPPISWLLLFSQRKNVRMEITAPPVCPKGEAFDVRVRATGGAAFLFGFSEADLRVENAVTGERARLRVFPQAGGVARVCGRHCGCLRLEIASARLYDAFGVLPVRLPCKAEKKTLAMPDPIAVAVGFAAAPAPFSENGEYADDKKGQDMAETFQVREYVPGDGLGQIHWKLTGKQGKLMVRDGSFPMDQSLLVYLDRFRGDLDPAGADALLTAVTSVCLALSEARIPFLLGWGGEVPQVEEVSSAEQFAGVLALLCNMQLGEKGGFSSYLRTYGMPQGGRVLYFGSELPQAWDLSACADARAFLCADAAAAPPGIVCFTPENVREVLHEASWW